MTNCDVNMSSYSNFVINKFKIRPFSVVVKLWSYQTEILYRGQFLNTNFNFTVHFEEENDFFLYFWLTFVKALSENVDYGNKRKSIFLVLLSRHYQNSFRKSQKVSRKKLLSIRSYAKKTSSPSWVNSRTVLYVLLSVYFRIGVLRLISIH